MFKPVLVTLEVLKDIFHLLVVLKLKKHLLGLPEILQGVEALEDGINKVQFLIVKFECFGIVLGQI